MGNVKQFVKKCFLIIPVLPVTNGQSILDIGGSNGLLAKEMKTVFPYSQITVIDLPDIVSPLPATKGINYHPANFFRPWNISSEIVIMARILHDWNDKKAAMILQNARSAILPGGKLLIIEMILDETVPNGHLCDLHLLAVTGGKERTMQQYRDLLKTNGFSLVKVHSCPGFISIIEAHINE